MLFFCNYTGYDELESMVSKVSKPLSKEKRFSILGLKCDFCGFVY